MLYKYVFYDYDIEKMVFCTIEILLDKHKYIFCNNDSNPLML